MKKLLALVLVLGIASLATAGIDLNTIPGISYEVSGSTVIISAENCTGFSFQLMPDTGSGDDLSNDTIGAGFGALANKGIPYGSYGFIGIGASTGTGAAVSGVIYTIDFAPAVQSIDFFNSDLAGGSEIVIGGQVIDLTGYSMVPEPATMGLLAIGGLFLARRKK